ncbi:MAG: FkbM family methyltransferase [Planctomycetaceae bacterium]
MFNKIMAEYNFRTGRRRHDTTRLTRAARQDRYNIRAAMELSRMGSPDAVCSSLLMTLAGLRDFAIRNQLDDEAREFLQLTIQQIEHSRGQCFQDTAAVYFSRQKRDGYFVEIGTGNGEHLSNTFMLEKQFGWSGILFEPDRRFHESIAERRSAILDERPVFSSDDQVLQFMEVSRAGELSTLSDFRREDGRHRFGACREVRTTTLTSALEHHNAPKTIDYVSIDTEGSEMEVLQGIDFDRYDIRFLTIEHNFVEGKQKALADFLAPHGYRPVLEGFSCQDIWLVKD